MGKLSTLLFILLITLTACAPLTPTAGATQAIAPAETSAPTTTPIPPTLLPPTSTPTEVPAIVTEELSPELVKAEQGYFNYLPGIDERVKAKFGSTVYFSELEAADQMGVVQEVFLDRLAADGYENIMFNHEYRMLQFNHEGSDEVLYFAIKASPYDANLYKEGFMTYGGTIETSGGGYGPFDEVVDVYGTGYLVQVDKDGDGMIRVETPEGIVELPIPAKGDLKMTIMSALDRRDPDNETKEILFSQEHLDHPQAALLADYFLAVLMDEYPQLKEKDYLILEIMAYDLVPSDGVPQNATKPWDNDYLTLGSPAHAFSVDETEDTLTIRVAFPSSENDGQQLKTALTAMESTLNQLSGQPAVSMNIVRLNTKLSYGDFTLFVVGGHPPQQKEFVMIIDK